MLLARERFSLSVTARSNRLSGSVNALTTWHEEQLLIDGKLTPAEGGATYENVNPATEAVLGVAADATVDDARRAIAAAARVRHDANGHATTRSACGACASCTRRCSTTSIR